MKIGLFDSGIGGLLIAHAVIQGLPQYDYCFLGDSARVPYGNRSPETVYRFTEQAVQYLFEQDCAIVIIACNTASAVALRRLQQEYLPAHYPDRRLLGVLVPAAEAAADAGSNGPIGVLATAGTITSGVFEQEIHRYNPSAKVIQQAAPLLVPLVENNGLEWSRPILASYLAPLLEANITTLVLGCTHYPVFKPLLKQLVPDTLKLVSPEEIIPPAFRNYLDRHPELEGQLSQNQDRSFVVTDYTEAMADLAQQLFGEPIKLEVVALPTLS